MKVKVYELIDILTELEDDDKEVLIDVNGMKYKTEKYLGDLPIISVDETAFYVFINVEAEE